MTIYQKIEEQLTATVGDIYIADVNVEGFLCDFFIPTLNTVILVENSEYQHSDAYYSIVDCSEKLKKQQYTVLVLDKDTVNTPWQVKLPSNTL